MSSRGSVIAGCALVTLMTALIIAGQAVPIVMYSVLTDGAMVIAWLLAAAGWGALVAWRTRSIKTVALRVMLSVATGLGGMSVVILLLGLAGCMNALVAWAILAVGWVIVLIGAIFSAQVRDRHLLRGWLKERATFAWFWLATTPMLAVVLVAAVAPPGVLWGDEPNGYDVVEYHLQVPREWYEAGRIEPLSHNAYSYLPMGMEMHYLLAMHLRGGPWAAMYLAQFMHAAMIALSVVAVAACAREVTGQDRAGVIAGLAMSSAPWLMLLAPVAYNEGGLLLFGTCTIGTLWKSQSGKPPGGLRCDWIVAGALAGFACGVKLTAAPMLLVAVPIALLLAGVRTVSRALLMKLALFVVAGVITFSPWLVRNMVWTGNPVFPEGMSLLGRGRFTDVQAERWRRAHSPPARLQPVGARLVESGNQIVFDWRYGYALLPLAIIAIVMRRRSRDAVFLLVTLINMFFVWIGFTHLQSRFFVLAIPVAALAIVHLTIIPRTLVASLLSLAILIGLVRLLLTYHTDANGQPRLIAKVIGAGAMGIERLDVFSGVDLSDVPVDRTVALVGDARAFVYSRPMLRLRYRTVFDVDATPVSSPIDAWLGSEVLSNPIIVVDPNELRRFSDLKTGYWQIPAPPSDIAARSEPFILQQ